MDSVCECKLCKEYNRTQCTPELFDFQREWIARVGREPNEILAEMKFKEVKTKEEAPVLRFNDKSIRGGLSVPCAIYPNRQIRCNHDECIEAYIERYPHLEYKIRKHIMEADNGCQG